MALVRVAQYSSTPTVIGDYQAQNAHLQAFTNQLLTQQFILDSGTDQPVIKQGCYVSHGGSLYVADADTSITGSPADGSVYIRVSGTTSLTVEFVTDISGYAWNPVYSALTSGSYTLLPYLIVKAGTVWARYNFNPNNQSFGDTRLNSLAVLNNATVGGTLGVTGAISGASLNTGSGAFTFNQGVNTTDSPTFDSIITNTGDIKILSGLRKLTGYARNNTFVGGLAWWGSFNSIFPYKDAPSGYYIATGAIMKETTNEEFIVAFINYTIDTEVQIFCYQIGVGKFTIITISPTSSTKYKGIIGF